MGTCILEPVSQSRKKIYFLVDLLIRLQLRATPDAAAIAQSDEVIKTFLLACETKNVKLCAIGLSCLQKLTAHDAVPATSLPQILTTLEQVGLNPSPFIDVECHLVFFS
jgi:hypothetical protein